MEWKRFDIETKTEASDLIVSELADLAITSVEISDNRPMPVEMLGGLAISVPADLPEDDGLATISFYLEDDDNSYQEIIGKVKEMLEGLRPIVDIGSGIIKESHTKEEDWINNWKEYWHTFSIGDLLIKPTWENVNEDANIKHVLSLDPGRAFGTGAHETTSLVISAIQKLLKGGEEVLDIGCGSGILSIVSIMYGAKKAIGVDLDEAAIEASFENAKENNIDSNKVNFIKGNIISDDTFGRDIGYEAFDLVLANILPEVLLPLSPVVSNFMKKGALLVYSGILQFKENEVKEAINKNPYLELVDTIYDGEWLAIVARKK